MTIPLWALLFFAGWTVLLLLVTVGSHRWSQILTGRAQIKEFRADVRQGPDWYQRAMRAHANCVENLPVYGALVLVLVAADIHDPIVDVLAVILVAARVPHSIVHVAFQQTNLVTSFRFAFFFVQLVCMIGIGGYVATAALEDGGAGAEVSASYREGAPR